MPQHGTDLRRLSFFKKLGVLIGLIGEVATVILSKMTDSQLQSHIGDKENLKKKLHKSFQEIFAITDLFVEEKEQWRKFYQKHFSMELNFADVLIPEKPVEDTWRLLIIAQGITLNQTYDVMSKAFKSWRYSSDLDASLTKNARDTKITYAVWVRDGVEPDEKYLGKSTNQADPTMAIGVTLLERMIHEIVFFDETGNHLDIKGVTFCTGSRSSDGNVPSMCWSQNGAEVRVGWYDLDGSDGRCGLREAVSL